VRRSISPFLQRHRAARRGAEVMIYALLWTSRSRRRERLVPATAAMRRRKTQQRVVCAVMRRKSQTSAPSLHKTCQQGRQVKGSKMSSQAWVAARELHQCPTVQLG
jgi:peroxiredoxin family protein